MLKPYLRKNITDTDIRDFLTMLESSSNINEQLLAYCLCIEIKSGMTAESDILDTFAKVKAKSLPLNFTSFSDCRKICLTREYQDTRKQYSRVVEKSTFETFIGSFKTASSRIDERKITGYGWSSANGIVWVTPKERIDYIWNNSKAKKYPADDICDYLGFPRNESDLEFVKIDYSPHFRDKVYQPNSSNRLWHHAYNLFLACPSSDNFGMTYNENNIEFAKEHIHEKSTYYDVHFEAHPIGKCSAAFPIHNEIITEAQKRLGIWKKK